MKYIPILMSAPMVEAVLEGRKTETRRVMLPQPEHRWNYLNTNSDGSANFCSGDHDRSWKCEGDVTIDCPYGGAGDFLWVRETFYAYGYWRKDWEPETERIRWTFEDITEQRGYPYRYVVKQEGERIISRDRDQISPGWWKRPAIFMPRAASRIRLEVEHVTPQRVGQINSKNIEAEGVKFEILHDREADGWLHPCDEIRAFHLWQELWDGLNASRGYSMESNPWVWVVKFKAFKEETEKWQTKFLIRKQ